MSVLRLSAAAAVIGLSLAAGALAEPARTSALSASVTAFTWSDGPRDAYTYVPGGVAGNVGEMCSEGFPCDDTLLEIKDAGTLTIKTTGAGQVRADVDLYLYTSNASGVAVKQLKASEGEATEESIIQKVTPGFYLVRAAYFSGVQVSYEATATLTNIGAAPATAPAAPAAPSAPATPAFTASAALGKARLSKATRTGLPVTVTCSIACKASFALMLSKADAKKLKLSDRRLGKAAGVDGGRTVFVKLPAKAAKKLAKAKAATIELVGAAAPAAGGATTPLKAKAKLKR